MADLPFIGARISLISKSDIRYEGILHGIDREKSSVTLSQVFSLGTEDRVSIPEKYVPARTNVYPYIVFRGSDIKDLHVDEAMPPQSQCFDQDPAIMSVSQCPPDFQQQQSQGQQQQQQYIQHQQQQAAYQYQQPQQQPPQQPPQHGSQQQKGKTSLQPQPQQMQPQHPEHDQEPQRQQEELDRQSDQHEPQQRISRDVSSPQLGETKKESTKQWKVANGTRALPGTGAYVHNKMNRLRGQVSVMEDFDIDAANAKFDKDSIADSFAEMRLGTNDNACVDGVSGDTVIPPVEPTSLYDKKKSFFDNISCVTRERHSESKQHDLNIETFGISRMPSYNFSNRSRGRGGGRGQRGFGNGRGGGHGGGRGGDGSRGRGRGTGERGRGRGNGERGRGRSERGRGSGERSDDGRAHYGGNDFSNNQNFNGRSSDSFYQSNGRSKNYRIKANDENHKRPQNSGNDSSRTFI